MRILDLRSDTVTKPTKEMRDAMYCAEVGDAVLGDDPTVEKLEAMGAELFGKEACLMTASGTMSNQAAVLSMTSRGDQIVVHDRSHIYNLEVAALAQICGVQARAIPTTDGRYDLGVLEENLVSAAIQTAPTTLVCMENTLDLNRGLVVSKTHIDEVCAAAHSRSVPVYMDGARILNAAVAMDIAPAALCENTDVVSLCLSKGLACPIGSLLAGPREVIEKAKRMRQMLGGGWRQAGVVAAAGIVALNGYDRLAEDHEKARTLAAELKEMGLGIDMEQVQTNIVKIDTEPVGLTALEFCKELQDRGILAKPIGKYAVRMICHIDIAAADIALVLKSVKRVIEA